MYHRPLAQESWLKDLSLAQNILFATSFEPIDSAIDSKFFSLENFAGLVACLLKQFILETTGDLFSNLKNLNGK